MTRGFQRLYGWCSATSNWELMYISLTHILNWHKYEHTQEIIGHSPTCWKVGISFIVVDTKISSLLTGLYETALSLLKDT